MKVDRVILASNTDTLYSDFWNNISYTYKEKFDIKPTLIFFGTEEDFKNLNLSYDYGDVIFENSISNIPAWQYTWALFYYTKFFSEDVCAIMGIDQIPLGTYFLKDIIQDIDDDKYVMLIDDQYKYENKTKNKWDEGGYSPSAYHIAKGKTFNEIFKFEKTFDSEIKKVSASNVPTMWKNGWGMDEAYSCKILREYHDRKRIIDLSKTKDFLDKRIDCIRNLEVPYSLENLKNNYYIECHSCRPYSNHKNYLDILFNSIPNFK